MNNPISPAYIDAQRSKLRVPESVITYPAFQRQAYTQLAQNVQPQPQHRTTTKNSSRTVYVLYALCFVALWVLLATGGF